MVEQEARLGEAMFKKSRFAICSRTPKSIFVEIRLKY